MTSTTSREVLKVTIDKNGKFVLRRAGLSAIWMKADTLEEIEDHVAGLAQEWGCEVDLRKGKGFK